MIWYAPTDRLSDVFTSKFSVDAAPVPIWVNLMKLGNTVRFASEAVFVIVIAGFSGVANGPPIWKNKVGWVTW
jgi:hypothetical protein